jgi:hypothetical protein
MAFDRRGRGAFIFWLIGIVTTGVIAEAATGRQVTGVVAEPD